jgi:hypothetical protein
VNYLIRTFFQSFGFALLIGAFALDPQKTEFRDFVLLLHLQGFWQIVILNAMALLGVDMIFGGHVSVAISTACNVSKRIRENHLSLTGNRKEYD